MVKLCQGISINSFQSLPQDRSNYFNPKLLVTDNARIISKHMLPLKVLLYSLGVTLTQREKCPNKELFLVPIFPHSDCSPYSVRMRENTDQK